MNKKMVSSILAVLIIFISWLLINYLSNELNRPINNKYLIIPFLWSCLFIYLHGKNHFYTAINSYSIFLLMLFADILNFGATSLVIQVSYLLPSFLVVFTFVFFYQELFAKKPRIASIFSFIVAIIFYAVPMLYIIYAINFDTVITRDVFFAISQTNPNESLEFAIYYISPIWIGVTLFLAFLTGVVLLKQEKKETFKIEKSLLIFMAVIFATLSYINSKDNRLYSYTKNSVKLYLKEIDLFEKTQKKLKNNEIQFEAKKAETGETYFVVIGESLNKKNMGLYGYMRDTTPLLNKILRNGNSIVFDNAFSSHTHTMPVLSLSLTEANQLNGKNYYESLTIVNILNKANFETYWITNQVLYGEWDNLISVIAHETDHLTALNRSIGKESRTQRYDGALIKEVKKVLAEETDKNRVIFLHLMGSHTDYCSRYPKKDYSIYNGALKKGEFGNLADLNGLNNRVNCYDNSIVYNDYVVSSFLKMIQEQKGITGLIYMSDHADDVFGRRGHNSGKFTFEMTQIPMIAWFSDQYKSRYTKKYNALKKNINALYSNDFFYDTLIGLFNIKTERYEPFHDLSSPDYQLTTDQSYTLHREKLYTDRSNYIWWQKKNTKFLIDTNQSSRVLPHRVNSIGKLKDIWNDGLRSFEVDVSFGDNSTNVFQVGHNQGVMGNSLENFLSSVKYSVAQKIWLDFKNLNTNNYVKAIERLNHLDKKYDIKQKIIIESNTTLPFFQELRKDGWHTSYYLPTNKIVKLLKENNIKEMKQLAFKIGIQSKSQNLSAISFDYRLYPFVKHYLEPLLSNNIVYHTWDLSLGQYDSEFYSELRKKNYFIDERVNTILLPYKSPFNL